MYCFLGTPSGCFKTGEKSGGIFPVFTSILSTQWKRSVEITVDLLDGVPGVDGAGEVDVVLAAALLQSLLEGSRKSRTIPSSMAKI